MHLFFVPDSCGGFRRLYENTGFEEGLDDLPTVEVVETSGELSWELKEPLQED
jgi:hypothetical protein